MPKRSYVRDGFGRFAETGGNSGHRLSEAFNRAETSAVARTPTAGMSLQAYLRHRQKREQHGIPNPKETAAAQGARLGQASTKPMDTEARKADIVQAKREYLDTHAHAFPGWDGTTGRWTNRGRGSGFSEFNDGIDGKGPHAAGLAGVAEMEAAYDRDLDRDPHTHQLIARILNEDRRERLASNRQDAGDGRRN